MAHCSFCGAEIPRGTGLLYIKKDAKNYWFCSRKCEKNLIQLRRKPRNQPWTAEAKTNKEVAKATAEHREAKPEPEKSPAKVAKAEQKEAKPSKGPEKAEKKSGRKRDDSEETGEDA